ncbi:MAG: hypothetical protein JWM57_60, partial [Phycisphaerales bacterium]|nr:hypothetical protein [Phycisphaerales bacterium]
MAEHDVRPVGRGWTTGARDAELMAGLVFAHIVSLIFSCLMLMVGISIVDASRSRNEPWPIILVILSWLGIIALDIGLLKPIWSHRYIPGRSDPTHAVVMASRRWPVRIALATWWLAHFAVGLAAAGAVEYVQSILPALPHEDSIRADLVMSIVVAFGFSFAGNVFLALATAQLTRKLKVARWIWNTRLLWDALVAITVGVFVLCR